MNGNPLRCRREIDNHFNHLLKQAASIARMNFDRNLYRITMILSYKNEYLMDARYEFGAWEAVIYCEANYGQIIYYISLHASEIFGNN